ncbi:hypothetical protein SEUCBS139899_010042 [Sporothrix eucalyptigena]|uniref:Uncharacterized protein n=1 Tax=Sporothrix eucalyptigena TaxID=1812306 RepID=A0ABP0CMS3_9PEZI
MRSVASLFAVAGLVQLASAACRPQYCRNAILAAGTGIDDCNAFLLTTVILPTETVYSTPTSAVTKTKTHTFSETETDSVTESFQPSVVIWSTYTSVDVINSVTHTTKKIVTTTTSPLYTKTTTTALATTTTTSTTMTTTTKNFFKRSVVEVPQPTTVTNSITSDYASVCTYIPRYVSNCLQLGATRSVTTIDPPIDSIVLSSTLVSTASEDVSVYVSSTLTKTTTKTLPSLHSTKTVDSTTIDVTSTSTLTSVTGTLTHTSKGITTSTLATTTTTTTFSTTSPTPYILSVSAQTSGSNAPSEVGYYIDWVTQAVQSALQDGVWTGAYALGFASKSSADNFVITSSGYLATIVSTTGSNGKQVNTQYVLTVVNGYVIPDPAPSASSTIITCSITQSGGSLYLTGCNYYLYATKYTSASNSGKTINLIGASSSSSVGGKLTLKASASSY